MGCFFLPAKVETSASRKGRAEKVSQNQLQVAGSFDNL